MKSLIPLAAGFIAIIAILTTLSSCNTVSGFGKDLQSLGETMEDTADDVSRGDRY